MEGLSRQKMKLRISELESRLEESEQLIDAIKAGEVDAFAINNNSKSEIFTLQSGDYAYRILIEKFGEGALNVTEDGLIVYTNSYFCNLIKVPYDKVIGSHITDFILPEYVNLFQNLFQQALLASCKGELSLGFGDMQVPVSLSLTSLQPKLPTVGIIVTDFTEKKNIEKVILKYQENLELNNTQLKQNNEELASFVYVASHDLQEPIRKIQTFASRVKETELSTLSKSGLRYFNGIQSAALRMQTLITDLLTYARTNKPELKFINTDLKNVLDEVIDEMKEELVASKAVVEIQELCDADIIQFQIKQLLNNLISNALKFAKPDKPPHITVNSHMVHGSELERVNLSKKQNYCHINLSDNGIGFEQEYSEKIFEVFQRLHGQSQYKGTGVGLAIVKKIVANHDGAVRATSSPDKGTSFDIYIPTRQKE